MNRTSLTGVLRMITPSVLYSFMFAVCCFAGGNVVIGQIALKDDPVKVIGSFMKVKSDGEHAYGYSVELWTHRDNIVGLISVHRGLIGDPPVGIIENVKYDANSKRFSFSAKVTLGLFSDRNHLHVESRDTIRFDGFLSEKHLKGEILTTNDLCIDKCPEKEKVSLPYWKDGVTRMNEYSSLKEWELYVRQILDRRGPKW